MDLMSSKNKLSELQFRRQRQAEVTHGLRVPVVAGSIRDIADAFPTSGRANSYLQINSAEGSVSEWLSRELCL